LYDKNQYFDIYDFFNHKSSLEILPVFGVAGKGQTISGHGGPTTNLHTKQTMRRLFIDTYAVIEKLFFSFALERL
jgi:hypothetical protein